MALEGVAVYRDIFEKHAGEWLVHRVTYTRLYAMEFDEHPHRLTSHLLGRRQTG